MFRDEYNIKKKSSNAMIGLRSVKNNLLNVECWSVGELFSSALWWPS